MEIKVKQLDLEGMYGWKIKEADISLVIDEVMGDYYVTTSALGLNHRCVTEEEMDFLLSLFEIKP